MIVDLSNKTAVITGAGGILCGNFALHMARRGAKVAILDFNYDAAKKTADQIKNEGGNAIAVQCNVLDKKSVEEAEKNVIKAFGGYNILINGAGGNDIKCSTSSETYNPADVNNPEKLSFFDLDPDLFQDILKLNLMGTVITSQVFIKGLLKAEAPCIINMSSMSSFGSGLTKVCAYGTSKAAVNSLTKWLAVHFGPVHIRVNAIAPGFFITHQNRAMMTNPDGTLSARSLKVIEHTPAGRMGEPDDLIGILLFLCDETASGYVNGVVVPVDGGLLATPNV